MMLRSRISTVALDGGCVSSTGCINAVRNRKVDVFNRENGYRRISAGCTDVLHCCENGQKISHSLASQIHYIPSPWNVRSLERSRVH